MYLSATAIKDYLNCPKQFHYRLLGEESEPNAYLVRGSIVHGIIEDRSITTSERAKEEFLERFSYDVEKFNPEFPYRTSFGKMVSQSYIMLENYYDVIDPQFPPPLEIEMQFEVEMGGIEYVGVIDQIRGTAIFDWKTATKPLDPVTRNADYQFTLYGMAYKQLFGEYPSHIYYGHLYNGEVYEMERTEAHYDYLREVVGPQIKFAVENELFPRNYSKYGCAFCRYKHLCFDENDKARY